jgi:hypothetical protein
MAPFTVARVCALVLTLATGPAESAKLPPRLGYSFYLAGRPVGRCDVQIRTEGDALRFESKLRVDTRGNRVELSTRAEADARTYALRSFSYRGTKAGIPVASNVTVQGDSLIGSTSSGGRTHRHRVFLTPGPVVVWEDWAMELEILLGLQQARENRNPSTRALLLANSYSVGEVVLGFTGEALAESATRSMSARKLAVQIEGGDPYECLIDPERGIPVYLRFPALKAEVFLDDFFGDNPTPKYQPAPPPASGP